MNKVVCVLAMALLFWPACSAEQNRASQKDRGTAESTRQRRQVYQDELQAKLRDLDNEIDALKTRIETDNKINRKDADRQMAELERRRQIAHVRLEKLRTSGDEAWGDMKAGIDAAMDNLDAAYKQATARFK